MAHYVQIPKDLNDIREKFIMGFTKRQVICFGIGLAIGAPVFFLTKKYDRHDGSNIRNGCLCCSCDPLWIVQEKWYFLGKTG